VVAVGAIGIVLYRRRSAPPAADTTEPAPGPPEPPPVLRVDGDTRRVYVRGNEARPPFSNEQFRLLHYLYERAGKVVGREELVQHVWPDANVEGVSEEALDALVRRVRERIVQAGGERTYLVTLRGQGFRLDV
jgi:DNA-binding response OmpR family regulator